MLNPRSKRRHLAALLLPASATVLVAGCSLLPWVSPAPEPVNPELPIGVQVVTSPAQMRLGVSNQTTIVVTLEVNGILVRVVEPGVAADLAALELPGLPWVTRVRGASGRGLVELTVRAGDIWRRRNPDGSTEAKGDGARVDLSCGRIDIWSGQLMGGQPPARARRATATRRSPAREVRNRPCQLDCPVILAADPGAGTRWDCQS